MFSNQRGDTNDHCHNEDSDRHTDGDQDFFLWERRSSEKLRREGRAAQGLGWDERGEEAHLPRLLLVFQGHLDMFLPPFHIVC